MKLEEVKEKLEDAYQLLNWDEFAQTIVNLITEEVKDKDFKIKSLEDDCIELERELMDRSY